MEASLHTFIDIFNTTFEIEQKTLKLDKIVIPKIQRDYAQGRNHKDIERIRQRFLSALFEAVESGNPITLDFVYGDIEVNNKKECIMTPLDGQQRLTTLFLLHWYAAMKADNLEKSDYTFLKNFSYDTRFSARLFCEKLVDFKPQFDGILSDEIKNQSWFPLYWSNDPTINAMLIMIDDINKKFANVQSLWHSLKNKVISFYFLPIKDMGITDDLYIKMNSRGKPLTMFEHFKAEFDHELSEINKKIATDIINKIDRDWTDLLWNYCTKDKNDNIIDDKFLRYFRFICDVIGYRQGIMSASKNFDEFALVNEFFSANKPNETKNNIEFLKNCFNCWCALEKSETIAKFFDERVSISGYQLGKIYAPNKKYANYFKDCIENYSAELRDIIMLYAFVTYLLNRKSIDDKDFRRRIRIILNLVKNSQFEIRETEMPKILKQVDSIIINGKILNDSFNTYQCKEETLKLTWTKQNPNLAESLYELEDHDLLYGQIDIIGLDNIKKCGKRFISLFKCDYDVINCALMATGDYKQCENGWRYQIGSNNDKSWQNLFHHSASTNFENTKKVLFKLLDKTDKFTNEYLESIKNDYIKFCENNKIFDWRYYYINYKVFRPGKYGKYAWNDFYNKPYEMTVLFTERNFSTNTYQPFLKAVENSKRIISREHLGTRLIYSDDYIECENAAYVIKDKSDNIKKQIFIQQNVRNLDSEDRIKNFLKQKL